MADARWLFRCDGGADVGLGHVTRSLAIARTLREIAPAAQVTFLGRFDAIATELVRHHGFGVLSRPAPGFGAADALPVCEIARGFDGVLIDSYALDQAHVDALSGQAFRLAVLDDLHALDLRRVDLAACFRPGAEAAPYGARREALGLRYLPVAPELRLLRQHRLAAPSEKVRRVLVFLGGGDIDPALPAGLVRAVQLPGMEVSYVGRDPSLVNGVAGVTAKAVSTDPAALLRDVDFLVCGGGLAKYEAAYVGIPSASLSQTPLQQEDTSRAAALGLTMDLGPSQEFRPEIVRNALAEAFADECTLRAQRAAFRAILDPESPLNLARHFLSP